MRNTNEIHSSNNIKQAKIRTFFETATQSSNRPLCNLNVDLKLYKKYSDAASFIFEPRNYELYDHDLEQFDGEYTEDIIKYILNNGDIYFREFEFYYLYDLFIFDMGVSKYFMRVKNGNYITLIEILESNFYKNLIDRLEIKYNNFD